MKSISIFSNHNDAGVGSIIETVCRAESAGLVIRAGRSDKSSFIQSGGRHVRLTQLSAGIVTGANMVISGGVVNPLTLAMEIDKLAALGLSDVPSRLFVEASTAVSTPYHTAIARLEILCGLPVKDWMGDSLALASNAPCIDALDVLIGGRKLRSKVDEIFEWGMNRSESLNSPSMPFDVMAPFARDVGEVVDEIQKLSSISKIITGYDRLLGGGCPVIHEGHRLCDEVIRVIPVYTTERSRFGKPTEIDALDTDNDNRNSLTEKQWLGDVRAGLVALGSTNKLAASSLAITKCDKLKNSSDWSYIDTRGDQPHPINKVDSSKFIGHMADLEKLPVKIESHGKTYQHKVLK